MTGVCTAGLVLRSPVVRSARRGPSPLIFHRQATIATCGRSAPTFHSFKIPDTACAHCVSSSSHRHAAGVALYMYIYIFLTHRSGHVDTVVWSWLVDKSVCPGRVRRVMSVSECDPLRLSCALRSSDRRTRGSVTAHVCASARLSGNAPRMRATRHACAPRATPDVLSSHISKLTFKPYCDLRLRVARRPP